VRIVLDTSALVSGFLWNGAPRRLIEAATAQQIEIFTTQTLIAELEEVSARSKFAARMAAQQLTPVLLAARYRAIAETVIPADIGPAVIADPDDDHVLACALAARAELIVSRDPHLLNLKHYQNIPILDPAQALLRIAQNLT
jgi:putative PIN family toxin of toxin-antitoxin system